MVEDYKDTYGMWRKSKEVNGRTVMTRSGRCWSDMNSRCKVGGSAQARRPTYIGCTTSDNFKCFQFFVEWGVRQVGYYEQGFAIEKDILYEGNRLYSEETCVFVPRGLNSFLLKHTAGRGQYAMGVHMHRPTGKFIGQVNDGTGSPTYLGLFSTEAAAKEAYKVAKESEARRWYMRLKSGEYIVDPRVIERMRTWTLEVE